MDDINAALVQLNVNSGLSNPDDTDLLTRPVEIIESDIEQISQSTAFVLITDELSDPTADIYATSNPLLNASANQKPRPIIINRNLSLVRNEHSVSYPSLPSLSQDQKSEFDKSTRSVLGPLYTRKTISTTDDSSIGADKKYTKRRPSFQGNAALINAQLKRNHSSLPALNPVESPAAQPKAARKLSFDIQRTRGVHGSIPVLYTRTTHDYKFMQPNVRRKSFQSDSQLNPADLALLIEQQKIQAQHLLDPNYSESSEQQIPVSADRRHSANRDYFDYLLMSRRCSNSFINHVDSADVVHTEAINTKVKSIGPYILGDVIGKGLIAMLPLLFQGAFGKVKEGVDSTTLQRIAVKIINKKRARKSNGGLENVYREIEMLRRVNKSNKHVIELLDVYCKVEDEYETKAVFNWFRTIEDEPIIWIEDDGGEVDKTVNVLKFYLVFEYCPSTLQVIIDQNGTLTADYARK